jgi:hypothetical protein
MEKAMQNLSDHLERELTESGAGANLCPRVAGFCASARLFYVVAHCQGANRGCLPKRQRRHCVSRFADRKELEQILAALFDRVIQEPAIVDQLVAVDLVLRFRYTDPEAVITIDLTRKPPRYRFDDQGKADVEMIQSADGARLEIFALVRGRLRAAACALPGIEVSSQRLTYYCDCVNHSSLE